MKHIKKFELFSLNESLIGKLFGGDKKKTEEIIKKVQDAFKGVELFLPEGKDELYLRNNTSKDPKFIGLPRVLVIFTNNKLSRDEVLREAKKGTSPVVIIPLGNNEVLAEKDEKNFQNLSKFVIDKMKDIMERFRKAGFFDGESRPDFNKNFILPMVCIEKDSEPGKPIDSDKAPNYEVKDQPYGEKERFRLYLTSKKVIFDKLNM